MGSYGPNAPPGRAARILVRVFAFLFLLGSYLFGLFVCIFPLGLFGLFGQLPDPFGEILGVLVLVVVALIPAGLTLVLRKAAQRPGTAVAFIVSIIGLWCADVLLFWLYVLRG